MFEKITELLKKNKQSPLTSLFRYIDGKPVDNYGYDNALGDMAYGISYCTGIYINNFVQAKMFLGREYYWQHEFSGISPRLLNNLPDIGDQEKKVMLKKELTEEQCNTLGVIFEKRIAALHQLHLFFLAYCREYACFFSMFDQLAIREGISSEALMDAIVNRMIYPDKSPIDDNKAYKSFKKNVQNSDDQIDLDESYYKILNKSVFEDHIVEKFLSQMQFVWEICKDYSCDADRSKKHVNAVVLMSAPPAVSYEFERYYGHPLVDECMNICDPKTGSVFDEYLDITFGWTEDIISRFKEKYPELFDSMTYSGYEVQIITLKTQEATMLDEKLKKQYFTRK